MSFPEEQSYGIIPLIFCISSYSPLYHWDIQKVWRYLCTENQYWSAVIFGPSGGTDVRHRCETQHMVLGTLPKTTVSEYALLPHSQIEAKSPPHKAETIYKHVQETQLASLWELFHFASVHIQWAGASLSCGFTNQNFNFFLKTMGAPSCEVKFRGTTQLVICAHFKSQHAWWYGGAWVHIAWVACTSEEDIINPERHIQVLEEQSFSMTFGKKIPSHILHILWQQKSLGAKLACMQSRTCQLLKTFGVSWK